MRNAIVLALVAATAISGCHKAPPPAPRQEAAKPAAADTAPGKVNVAQLHDSIEKAMDETPPALRNQFQKEYGCEVAANNKLPAAKQRSMDASWIREITAKLKTNPHLGDVCQ